MNDLRGVDLAEVNNPPIAHVHVSGHASQEEMKLILALVRPRFFIPVHGEPRHLHLHARLAEAMGIPRERIISLRDGDVLEINHDGFKVAEQVPAGYVFVDGSGVGDVGPSVLSERDALARDGFVVAVIPIHKNTRELAGKIDIATRGAIYKEQADATLNEARDALAKALRKSKRSNTALENTASQSLGRFFYQTSRRNPIIVPIIVEVD
ncbi:MAG: ribonuclease J [Caldilineales bacterium]|nr:ribonuclease J [Caldilineales bacterium]